MDRFIQCELIEKGWSEDKKYSAVFPNGDRVLYRVSAADQYERKKAEFDIMKQIAALGIPMCMPLEFGTCEDGVYSIQSWIDGVSAEEEIPLLADTEQYVHGLQAGQILHKIHSIPAPAGREGWESRFGRKIDRKIRGYHDCPIGFEGADHMLRYIEEHRHLLKGRPQCLQHGDYHIGNMIIDPSGVLTVIDFNRWDYGDPWEEFNRIVWCAQKSHLFATGMVNGYFGGTPPMEFWKLLALYISSNTLSSVYWAVPFGQKEIDTMKRQAAEVLGWYDNMNRPVPSWYLGNPCVQTTDGLTYMLKSPFDFSFLSRYGRVFRIFDGQDSGNICFGTEKDGRRYFIKFAGAPTARYDGKPEDAISRLKSTVPVYQDLRHPNLIEYLGCEEIGGGFAMIFAWADGECMGRMFPKSRRRFLQTDTKARMQVYLDILSFLEYTASQGYIAIDFYDGSIMYDFTRHKTVICDIDFFRKKPCVNDMGRMWGSSLFQSPEEYRLGAVIDEVTNVYTAGAMAFALFSGYCRSPEDWPLGSKRYEVVCRAVHEDRDCRQQSIRQLIGEWTAAADPLDI